MKKQSRKTRRSGQNVESVFILSYPNVCITCNIWNSTIFEVWNIRACTFASALSSSSCVLIKVKTNHRNTCTEWSECARTAYVSFGKWTNEKNGSSWLAKKWREMENGNAKLHSCCSMQITFEWTIRLIQEITKLQAINCTAKREN